MLAFLQLYNTADAYDENIRVKKWLWLTTADPQRLNSIKANENIRIVYKEYVLELR